MKLYHYVHCPFCVRVRMACGLLNFEYQSIVLPYDDEKTPIDLCQKKMLPIATFDNGNSLNESLDIIRAIDSTNELTNSTNASAILEQDTLLNKLGKNVHNLAMPYWIYTPEFNESSREYFQSKKEVKRGPFKDLVKKRDQFISALNQDLNGLENDLIPFYQSKKFTLLDILLASHLWGMYVVPEYQFPDKIHRYLQGVKEYCHFDYHQDFWK